MKWHYTLHDGVSVPGENRRSDRVVAPNSSFWIYPRSDQMVQRDRWDRLVHTNMKREWHKQLLIAAVSVFERIKYVTAMIWFSNTEISPISAQKGGKGEQINNVTCSLLVVSRWHQCRAKQEKWLIPVRCSHLFWDLLPFTDKGANLNLQEI